MNLLRSVADLTGDNRKTVATALSLIRYTFHGETLHLLEPGP